MIHKIKKLKGYSDPQGKYLYECACGKVISAWTIKKAQVKHKEERQKKDDN